MKKTKVIRGDLFIGGNLITGDDGQLFASGSISWGNNQVDIKNTEIQEYLQKSVIASVGDFDISDSRYLVYGSVYVHGKIDYPGTPCAAQGEWKVVSGVNENALNSLQIEANTHIQ